MRPTCLILVAAALVLGACSRPQPSTMRPQVRPEAVTQQGAAGHGDHHGEQNAAAPAQPGANGSRRFGEALAAGAPVVRLADIVNAPQQFQGRPLRVEGRIVAVCQHMGCWMEMRDDQTQAHVRMHGHSFFVPRNVDGKRAAVQATLVAAHPPTECDQSAQAATGRVAQVELDATGVEVYD